MSQQFQIQNVARDTEQFKGWQNKLGHKRSEVVAIVEVIALSFTVLLGYMHNAIAELSDPRQKSNALRYSLKDIVLGAFSAFFMQVDERYLQARIQWGKRTGFFQDLLTLTKYLLFESWQHLLDFLLGKAEPLYPSNSS
jgi:hypothetical protein